MNWSLIIPTFNCAKYLATSLSSALNQKFKDFEIIIIDDASTDNTFHKIKDYNIKYLKLENGPHSQVYSWQKGIDISRGDYIGFIDADDWLSPIALEEMNNYYQSNPEIICAWSQNDIFNQSLSKKIRTGFSEDPYLYGSLINGMLQPYPGLMISHFITCKRQSIIELGGLDTTLPTSIDRWLALKLDLKGKLGFLDKSLYRYRFMRKGSITKNKRLLQISTLEKILNGALKDRNIDKKVELKIRDNNFDYDIYITP